jgi:hypothetical protein
MMRVKIAADGGRLPAGQFSVFSFQLLASSFGFAEN